MSLLRHLWRNRTSRQDRTGAELPRRAASDPPPPEVEPDSGGTRLRSSKETPVAAHAPGLALDLTALAPGDRLADAYTIERRLGEGGMGTVYLVQHEAWDLDVVVKVPKPEILADPEHAHRISQEAEAWTALGLHPHIAYCFYVHPIAGVPLLVVEYVDGGNLRDAIATGRCTELAVGLDLAIQLCHGLEHAHGQGLIHRDVKPENLLLAADGTLKVTDFGIVGVQSGDGDRPAAIVPDAGAAGHTMGTIGTYEYMAPEQFSGAHEVGVRADLFAIGVCLYEIFCGRRPYELAVGEPREAPDPRALRGDDGLPERLCGLLGRSVAWLPESRPESAREMRRELCAIRAAACGDASPYAELPEVSLAADGWNNRGVSYHYLGRETDAEAAWEQALAADPQHLEATYNLGVQRWRTAKLTDDACVKRLETAAGTLGWPWEAKYLVGLVQLERGDVEAAVRLLEEAAGSAPGATEVQAALDVACSGRVAAARCLRTFEGHVNLVRSVCLSTDGRWALSGSLDQTLRLWEVASAQCVRTFEGHGDAVRSVCLSADARWALSGSEDRTLRLWEVASGRCVRTFEGHGGSVDSVCLSADGRWALSGSRDFTLRLWEMGSGRCVRTFEGHSGGVSSVCPSADGRWALSGSGDKTLRLWDVASGTCLRTFEGHGDVVSSVCLSADGRWALSGSWDQTLRLWEVTSGTCVLPAADDRPAHPAPVTRN